MNILKNFPLSKIALLLLTLLFAPHSLNNCYHHAFPQIDADFFFSLLLMVITIFIAWALLQYFQKNPSKLFGRSVMVVEGYIFKTHTGLFVSCCTIIVLLSGYIVSLKMYDLVPRVSDEIAQLFQARIFLSGHLTAPSPPMPEFFTYSVDNMIVSPKWYSQYPPGYPFMLTMGLFLGNPWIINPLLAAISVVLVFLLSKEAYNRTTAVVSVFLFSLSPKVIFTSGSLLNNTAAMFLMLLSFATLLGSLRKNNALLALCAGLSIGLSLNIRPLDAVVMYIPIGIYFLIRCFHGRNGLKLLGMWLCGFGIMAIILLLYNYKTNGDPFLFGYIVRWGENHYLGFHAIRGGTVHTPWKGLTNTLWQIRLADKAMFEWPLPVIFFIALLFCFARALLWDWIFLSIILLNIGLYFFWGWVDPGFMGRFYFASTPYIIMLAARGVQCFVQILSKGLRADSMDVQSEKPARLLLVAGIFFLIAISTRYADFNPQYYIPHLQVDERLKKTIERQSIHKAIVFIEPQDAHELVVGSGFFMNTPDLASQDVIYAKDLGEKDYKLVQVFPGRQGYIYRHRRDVQKKIDDSYCISPPEAFELLPLKQ